MSDAQTAPAESYDHADVEKRLAERWEAAGLYRYDPKSAKPVYSIDTPPPYVSAAHLHVGHAMSYAQAEFIVRYRRMAGYSVFYPMGFDDNGLPTERYVEQKYKINRNTITRSKFRELCIEETAKGAVVYEQMWRALGLSVDWSLRYSTIDPHSRRTAQKSFLDLYGKGLLYRTSEPVLWDTTDETALAQADLDTMERKGKLYDVRFSDAASGADLIIATTRPELIPACVALFHHPEDSRYAGLGERRARVPLFDYDVPILASEDVDPSFGTGLMMVCTFGDGEDVKKWREHGLQTRLVIEKNGRMGELAGKYAGLHIPQARSAIVADLKEAGVVLNEKTVDQAVSIAERSGSPVEFQMAPQWFIRLLDFREAFLKRSAELDWRPPYMKSRLDHWIEGLKYDWNISRQRFYGVPFPVWYVEETGEVVLADEADLPVDPTEDAPPKWAQEKYAGKTLVGEADVMDTWMTSSLSPLINSNWAGTQGREAEAAPVPMSLRVQAFEIIRTWLFYTLAKSHFHCGALPWQAVMISGWGLNEQGKKISKRDLESFTDAQGFNRYDPQSVIDKYGADALRYWAAGARLGHDLKYNEKDVRAGRKIVVKLWNVARLCAMYLEDFDPKAARPPVAERPLEDRWLLSKLSELTGQVTESFESYDYAVGREAWDRFFWLSYCDNYLEIVKDRLWRPEAYPASSKAAAQATLWESLRRVIALCAPITPFIADEIYLKTFADLEGEPSIHVTPWPKADAGLADADAEAKMELVLQVLDAWRFVRTRDKIASREGIRGITLEAGAEVHSALKREDATLRAALRCDAFLFGTGDRDTNREGWRLSVDVVESRGDAA